jgi:excisionase family DNA binding protein
VKTTLPEQNTSGDIGIRPIVTLGEAAEFLEVSRRFIELEVARGHLPVIRLSPRCLRIRRSALEQYLNSRPTTA